MVDVNEENVPYTISEPKPMYMACKCGSKMFVDDCDSSNQNNTIKVMDEIGCNECHRLFYLCTICKLTFKLHCTVKINPQKLKENPNQNNNKSIKISEDKDNKYILCAKCLHGGHLLHYLEWFKTFLECPVPNCECKCFEKD